MLGFLDSLLGGLIAVVITSLLPRNPVVAARRAAALPLAQIAATLEDLARALDRADQNLAERALARARPVERDAFKDAVAAGRETLQLAPFARARANGLRATSALSADRRRDHERRDARSRRRARAPVWRQCAGSDARSDP